VSQLPKSEGEFFGAPRLFLNLGVLFRTVGINWDNNRLNSSALPQLTHVPDLCEAGSEVQAFANITGGVSEVDLINDLRD